MPAIEIFEDSTSDTTGIPVFESGAIMLEICERFPEARRFAPPERRTEIWEWLFWMNANLGPVAGQVGGELS